MSQTPQSGRSAVMVESELFSSQMAELDAETQGLIRRSLNRAREGRPTPGVEKPWEGDWLVWPCGEHQVILRPLTGEEVAAVAGTPQEGILLIAIEPSPF